MLRFGFFCVEVFVIWLNQISSFFFCIADTCSALLSTECASCNCDTAGSTSSTCDSNGHCTCKNKYYGPKCKNRNCEMTTWSAWTNCRCGYTDVKTRRRSVTTQPAGKGFKCWHTQETGTCVMTPCHCPTINPGYYGDRCDKRDCVAHPWSAWTACAPCPNGYTSGTRLPTITPRKYRKRGERIKKDGNGKSCGALSQTDVCGYRCVHACRSVVTMFASNTYCSYHTQ